MAQAQQPTLQQLQQQNLLARQILIKNCVNAWQNVYTNTFTTGAGTVINIPLRNVGLQKRIIVEVAATVSGSAGPTHTLTTLGSSTFFSNVLLTDLSNQTRINTPSWHLTAVASAKSRLAYGSAIKNASLDTPFGYGANNTKTQTAPATITATAASNNVFAMFEVPIAYSDMDLRGAIYANVVNATYNLQLTVNPNLLLATGTDASFAMYQSSNATVATLPSFTITVYQNYLDQLPVGQNGPILPILDVSTAYLLTSTNFAGLVNNTDNPFPYPNFRDIMSTTVVYDDNSALTAGKINYFAIQTANYTNMIKADENLVSLWNRLRLQDDFPTAMYYFDHRDKPISTVQYGNMALLINPNTVTGAASAFYFGYEMLAIINQVTNAGSLAGT